MTTITSVVLEAPDPATARAFYRDAFGPAVPVAVRASDAPTTGFRGFTLSLKVAQPGDVDRLVAAAVEHGATALKPPAKSLWGYGGAVRSPDGAIWTVASASKKDRGPATGAVEDVVLLLGAEDVPASKRFYVEQGLTVAKSFGRKYVEFALPDSPVKLALYGRRALAKTAGVAPEGTGSHRLVVEADAGPFTDPDGFGWAPAEATTARAA